MGNMVSNNMESDTETRRVISYSQVCALEAQKAFMKDAERKMNHAYDVLEKKKAFSDQMKDHGDDVLVTANLGKFKEPVTKAAATAYDVCWKSRFYTTNPDEARWDKVNIVDQHNECVAAHRKFLDVCAGAFPPS
jgi:hypothetical protein